MTNTDLPSEAPGQPNSSGKIEPADPGNHPSSSTNQHSNSTYLAQSVAPTLATQEANSTTTTNASPDNCRHSRHSSSQQDAQQQLLKAKRDLESMVLKYAKSEQENLQNKTRVEELSNKLKRTIKDNDQLANRIKLLTNDKSQLADSLSSKVAQLTVLEHKNSYLNSVQGVKLKEYEEKIQKLESSNEQLLEQVEQYRSKQTELMDFSERLSMKHMLLQTELDEALKKVPSYKEQHENSLRERDAAIQQREELSEQIDTLSESLSNEQRLTESLRTALDEAERRYKTATDEHHNEIKMMRRKHQLAVRELVKEIKQLQVRLGEPVAGQQVRIND